MGKSNVSKKLGIALYRLRFKQRKINLTVSRTSSHIGSLLLICEISEAVISRFFFDFLKKKKNIYPKNNDKKITT